MNNLFDDALAELKDLQRSAVDWQDGAALILAGPGSGKTRVLTTRIARLIQESPTQKFRILALTFTNKAADEMMKRVEQLCANCEDRFFIVSFR